VKILQSETFMQSWFSRCSIPLAAALVGATLAAGGGPAWAQDVSTEAITLHYNSRVPYDYLKDGVVKGLVATPVAQAFKQAGVEFTWVETPVARQFNVVKRNLGLDCLAGRFKNDDRALWARFSRPVYRDRPQGLLVRRGNEKLRDFISIHAAVRSPDLTLLVKASYSYGPVLDAAIRERTVPPITTYDESADMLRQIQRGMADAFIIAAEEADGLLANGTAPTQDFAFLSYPDAPAGELRYIMCSHKVPQSVMDKLGAAITFKDR